MRTVLLILSLCSTLRATRAESRVALAPLARDACEDNPGLLLDTRTLPALSAAGDTVALVVTHGTAREFAARAVEIIRLDAPASPHLVELTADSWPEWDAVERATTPIERRAACRRFYARMRTRVADVNRDLEGFHAAFAPLATSIDDKQEPMRLSSRDGALRIEATSGRRTHGERDRRGRLVVRSGGRVVARVTLPSLHLVSGVLAPDELYSNVDAVWIARDAGIVLARAVYASNIDNWYVYDRGIALRIAASSGSSSGSRP